MIKINGEDINADGMTIAGYLAGSEYDGKRVAVECNGEIVPRASYGEVTLRDGDSVEIVCFVGGG